MNTFKKGDRVKYKTGRAKKAEKATFLRKLKAGTALPNVRDLVSTLDPGDELVFDSGLIELADGSKRIVGLGYLKAA